mgnify:FL=1
MYAIILGNNLLYVAKTFAFVTTTRFMKEEYLFSIIWKIGVTLTSHAES